MIEQRDVCEVGAALELEADVEPHGALGVGARVTLAVAVDRRALHAIAPGHPDEESSVCILVHHHVDHSISLAFEIDDVAIAAIAHRPCLFIPKYGTTVCA